MKAVRYTIYRKHHCTESTWENNQELAVHCSDFKMFLENRTITAGVTERQLN